MNAAALLEDIAPELRRRGLDAIEVYHKKGRSRRFELGPDGASVFVAAEEEGWMVRAGGRDGSFALATGGGAGRVPPVGPGGWPQADGPPLRLPEAAPVPPWRSPPDLEAPLVAEGEARAILEGIQRELAREAPGTRLLGALLEEGASEAELASTRGIAATVRARTAYLLLEAAAGAGGARLHLAARQASGFRPAPLARRLADRLAVAGGEAPERDRGELVLAPAVGAALLQGLLPLLVGPRGSRLAVALRDRRGRLGSAALTVLDDGRLPGGLLEAPVDGEGVPCGAVVLIAEGAYRQPLLAWWQARPGEGGSSGCSRRPGWRDLPAPGPTHLHVPADPEVPAASLLGGVTRGYYLLEPTGPGAFDFEAGSFALPVCGFSVRAGAAAAPLGEARLCGGIGALLRGVQARGRDLSFFPLGGMVGAPSLLVTGLELRRAG